MDLHNKQLKGTSVKEPSQAQQRPTIYKRKLQLASSQKYILLSVKTLYIIYLNSPC